VAILWAVVQFWFIRCASAQIVPLLQYTNIWRYHPNTNEPGYVTPEAWTAPSFDDQLWTSGRGLFGFETSPVVLGVFGPINTMIPPPSAGLPGQQNVSSYFRTHFEWNGPTSGIYFRLSCAADDGMIAYLNGVEFFSFNMPPSRPMTWGVSQLPGGNNPLGEEVPITADVPVMSLLPGDNVLAVELHQASLASGDDLFGMKLSAFQPAAPTTIIFDVPRDQVVLSGRPFTLQTGEFFSLLPLSYQWFEEGEPIPGATNSSYTATNEVPCTTPSGGVRHYYCRVNNTVGSVNTRMATITFVTDVDPPQLLRVVAIGSNDQLVAEFSEYLKPEGAEDIFNFVLRDAEGMEVDLAEARLAHNQTSVILTPEAPLRPGTLYTLSVGPDWVTDYCGLPVAATTLSFVSRIRNECDGILFETFIDPEGRQTLGLPPGQEPWWSTFPDAPASRVRRRGAFEGLEHSVTNGPYNYFGERMRALFVPPVSGPWRFFVRADDWGEVWLNPDGPGANGRRLIATGLATSPGFREPPANGTSAAFPLTAGRAYYLEARWSEGTGENYCQVAARLEGDSTPAAALNPIPENWLAPTLPADSLGSVVITQQPSTRSVPQFSETEFEVRVNTDVTLCYQWFRSGLAIPGANGPRYRFFADIGDVGHLFSVRIMVPGGSTLMSESATVYLLNVDIDGPRLLGADCDVDRRTVTLRWNDQLLAESVSHVERYLLDGVHPAAALLVQDTNIVLTVAEPLATCVPHVVVVQGVAGRSGNVQYPNPLSDSFQVPLPLVENSPAPLWRYSDEGIDLGTTWRERNYDDSAWRSGPGPLGFEDAAAMPAGWPIRTVLEQFAVAIDKTTVYFRTHFHLPTYPGTLTRFWLRDVVDDGCAVYLNGHLVLRQRLNEPIDFATIAPPSTEPHAVEGPFELPIGALRQGDNVLAVEVHQSSLRSGDVVFGAELFATVRACGVGLTVTRLSQEEARLDWPDASYHLEQAPSPSGSWTPVPGVVSGDTVRVDDGKGFFRLIK
jgi:hypothetical protein